jgi:hypothetical protein
MKKIAITFCFIFLGLFSFAQNTTDKALSDNIKVLNSAKTAQDLQNVKNKFTAQIKENSDWKPAYYAALSVLKQADLGLRTKKTENVEALANEAFSYLEPILASNPNNSEIKVLMAFAHIIKMENNSSDFIVEKKKARELLYLEVNTDKNNPRFELMRAKLEYIILKNSKTDKNLKSSFQNAAAKLKSFTPKSENDPNWGFNDAQYYISILK